MKSLKSCNEFSGDGCSQGVNHHLFCQYHMNPRECDYIDNFNKQLNDF